MYKSIFEQVYEGSVNEVMASKALKKLKVYKGQDYWNDVITVFNKDIDQSITDKLSSDSYPHVVFKDGSAIWWSDRDKWVGAKSARDASLKKFL